MTIFDERFPESVAFGKEVGRLGEATRVIRGDITQLWYNNIHAQWREQPLAIAGMTAPGPLFCLERWGWDAGLRVVYRAEHRSVHGSLQHAFTGPPHVLAEAETRVSGPNWAAQMARLAVTCHHGICKSDEASFTGFGDMLTTTDDEALVSWVIAPVVRA